MNVNVQTILEAAKATSIPEGTSGMWHIEKNTVKEPMYTLHRKKAFRLLPGVYTYLYCVTEATLHANGEVVMEDTPFELFTHMDFMLKAKGRVLITGLGLGCVIRGILSNGQVDHITCIERSQHVIDMVAPHMPTDRLEIIKADALEWTKATTERFDCAWHDIWTDWSAGEPSLAQSHTKLLKNCRSRVNFQGAWDYPRIARSYAARVAGMVVM